MNKEWRNMLIFIVVLFLIGWWLLFDLKNNKNYDVNYTYDEYSSNDNNEFSEITKLHWDHMPISFSFAKENVRESNVKCQDYQIKRVRQGFSIIENETNKIISFVEFDKSGDIIVYCNKAKAEDSIYMRVGDGRYYSYGNIIMNGELNFYIHYNCGTWPDMEIHEILHTFGYEHIEDEQSVMNPISKKCDLEKIDDLIIEDLINTYKKI